MFDVATAGLRVKAVGQFAVQPAARARGILRANLTAARRPTTTLAAAQVILIRVDVSCSTRHRPSAYARSANTNGSAPNTSIVQRAIGRVGGNLGQLTKADQKAVSRHADVESRKAEQKRRESDREQQREREAAEYRLHTAAGDVQNASIWGGPQWIPWAQIFDRAWQAYEDAAEAARSEAERERRLDLERAEYDREIERKMEAEAKAAKDKREREIEKQQKHEHVLRSRAAQARAREAWLRQRWHRRPCAALAKAASASIGCILDKLLAFIFIAAILASVIMLLEYGIKPMLASQDGIIERFRPDEVAPSLALTPMPIPQNIAQKEEYWLERRQWLQEGFDFWADAITARTVSGKQLPNNATLEYARDSLEYFHTELHTTNLRLAGFSNGNN